MLAGPLGRRPRQGGQRARPRSGHLTPSWSWFNPFDVPGPESFMVGFTLMLFIYWGWDTAVSVNEETKDATRSPGRAAVISTFILLAIYALVIIATQSYAGIGTHGIGLSNPNNVGDVLSVLGQLHLRHLRVRHLPLPPAPPDGAQLGRRLDPDHHPADRPHHAVDGRVQGDSRRLRQDPPAVPHPDGLDAGDGWHLHRALRGHELRVERQQRHRGLGVGPRRVDRLLLRAHRLLVRLVLPQDAARERPHPVDAGHPAPARRPHPVVRHVLVLLVLLEPGQQLHPLARFPAPTGSSVASSSSTWAR